MKYIFVWFSSFGLNCAANSAPIYVETDEWTNNLKLAWFGDGQCLGTSCYSHNPAFNFNKVAELEARERVPGAHKCTALIAAAKVEVAATLATIAEFGLVPADFVFWPGAVGGCGPTASKHCAETSAQNQHYFSDARRRQLFQSRHGQLMSFHDRGGSYVPVGGGKDSFFEEFAKFAAHCVYSPDSHHAASTPDAHTIGGCKNTWRRKMPDHSDDVRSCCYLMQLLNNVPAETMMEAFINDHGHDLADGDVEAIKERAKSNVARVYGIWADYHREVLEEYIESLPAPAVAVPVQGKVARKKIVHAVSTSKE